MDLSAWLGKCETSVTGQVDITDIKERLKNCCKEHIHIGCEPGCSFIPVKKKCGIRICPVCSDYRFKRMYAKYMPLAFNFKSAFFLTLTLRGHRSLSRFQKRKLDHYLTVLMRRYRRATKKRTALVNFYIRALEINKKRDGYYYHYHIIYDGKKIKKSELQKAWFDITGDSYIVHIDKIKEVDDVINYILKYVTKSSAIPIPIEDYKYFHNVRYIAVCGLRFPKHPKYRRECKKCSSPIKFLG
jgi:hypothetical protein